MNSDKALVVFQSKKIRRTWFKDEWYYSLVDIVKALTESANPTDHLKKLRKRDIELGSYLGTNCPLEKYKFLRNSLTLVRFILGAYHFTRTSDPTAWPGMPFSKRTLSAPLLP